MTFGIHWLILVFSAVFFWATAAIGQETTEPVFIIGRSVELKPTPACHRYDDAVSIFHAHEVNGFEAAQQRAADLTAPPAEGGEPACGKVEGVFRVAQATDTAVLQFPDGAKRVTIIKLVGTDGDIVFTAVTGVRFEFPPAI